MHFKVRQFCLASHQTRAACFAISASILEHRVIERQASVPLKVIMCGGQALNDTESFIQIEGKQEQPSKSLSSSRIWFPVIILS